MNFSNDDYTTTNYMSSSSQYSNPSYNRSSYCGIRYNNSIPPPVSRHDKPLAYGNLILPPVQLVNK